MFFRPVHIKLKHGQTGLLKSNFYTCLWMKTSTGLSSQHGYQGIGWFVNIAQIMSPGPWHEYCVDDITGLPRQHQSNSCGVFVLMYSLSFVTAGAFDFTEPDMPCIRRWWCLLLLENFPLRSDAERKQLRKKRRVERAEVMETPLPIDSLTKMPPDILWRILMGVVTDDGDVAFWRLSLTCKVFRDVVSDPKFREEAHFVWLDSVVNWSAFSIEYRQEFRVPYSLTLCLHCTEVYKDCPPGYVGDGRRGVLRAFYSEKEVEGYCSVDCFFNDGGEFQAE
ncbi:uncharacterized protein LOC143740869 isoform X4 [Siphateles boraxobius]|uniref:uncharacterized protein LOC143740869 isoform X4 n=1 Tax=Siphateles boraxobius TaxID=180520 RepID=UPI004062F514